MRMCVAIDWIQSRMQKRHPVIKKMCVFSLLLGVALVGCNREPSHATAASEAPLSRDGHPARAPEVLKPPLPDGFSLPLSFHVRDDRVVNVKEGVTERRILIDVLDADVSLARKRVTAMFKDKGFRGTRPVAHKGGQRVVYRHEDGRRVSVTFWSDQERKPQARNGRAVIYFGWVVPQ